MWRATQVPIIVSLFKNVDFSVGIGTDIYVLVTVFDFIPTTSTYSLNVWIVKKLRLGDSMLKILFQCEKDIRYATWPYFQTILHFKDGDTQDEYWFIALIYFSCIIVIILMRYAQIFERFFFSNFKIFFLVEAAKHYSFVYFDSFDKLSNL